MCVFFSPWSQDINNLDHSKRQQILIVIVQQASYLWEDILYSLSRQKCPFFKKTGLGTTFVGHRVVGVVMDLVGYVIFRYIMSKRAEVLKMILILKKSL